MTSQEQGKKIKEATARKWERRQARWTAWKAKQAEPTPAPETGTVGCTGMEALGAMQFEAFWKATEVKPELDALGNL